MSAGGPVTLIVDDDAALGRVLVDLLAQEGIGAVHVASGREALASLERGAFDVVLSDLRMPGIQGMELLGHIAARWPGLPVVMLTAHGTVPLAVEAMKAGAADFVLKPFDRDELLFVIRKALAAAERTSQSAPPLDVDGRELLGESSVMRDVHALVRRAAASTATVLVLGETGTGKGLVARAIHEASSRRGKPFITLHCGALPDTLLESELFGHERGAFTGAVSSKPGRIELAHDGTLFLDEIGDISPATQVKLLRVLQEREVDRLGGRQPVKVDVRFVAATHRDLQAMVAAGRFREDLFYRLNVVPILLPPLRERRGDIEHLAGRFVRALGAAHGRAKVDIDEAALGLLRLEDWPGNVRQLQNFVERLVVLSDGPTLRATDVERELSRDSRLAPSQVSSTAASLDDVVRTAERDALTTALQRAGGNRTLAARLLGVSRRGLYKKMAEHDVR